MSDDDRSSSGVAEKTANESASKEEEEPKDSSDDNPDNDDNDDDNNKDEYGKLKIVTKTRPQDVLFGRGRPLQVHPGNLRFHKIINQYREEYKASRKDDKATVTAQALAEIATPDLILKGDRSKSIDLSAMDGDTNKSIPNTGGRFLKRAPDGKNWQEVTTAEAMEKISHALRGIARRGSLRETPDEFAGAKRSATDADGSDPSKRFAQMPMNPNAAALTAPLMAAGAGNMSQQQLILALAQQQQQTQQLQHQLNFVLAQQQQQQNPQNNPMLAPLAMQQQQQMLFQQQQMQRQRQQQPMPPQVALAPQQVMIPPQPPHIAVANNAPEALRPALSPSMAPLSPQYGRDNFSDDDSDDSE